MDLVLQHPFGEVSGPFSVVQHVRRNFFQPFRKLFLAASDVFERRLQVGDQMRVVYAPSADFNAVRLLRAVDVLQPTRIHVGQVPELSRVEFKVCMRHGPRVPVFVFLQ